MSEETFVQPTLVCPLSTRELAKRVIQFGEAFCVGRSGKSIKLYTYQRTIALAIVEAALLGTGAQLTGVYARQVGKSEAMAVTALALAILLPILSREFPDDERLQPAANGFRIGIYAHKQEKAQIIYDRIRMYAQTERALEIYADPEVGLVMTASRGSSCAWSHGSLIVAQTASEQTDNEGHTWDLIIIDEAQKLSTKKVMKELKPMLKATNGPLVQIGTASYHKGYFFRTLEMNLEAERENPGLRLHFQYDYKQVIAERRAAYDREAQRYKRFVAASPAEQAAMLEKDPDANRLPNKYHLKYEESIQDDIKLLRGNLDDESFKMNYRLIWQDSRSIAIPSALFESLAIPGLEAGEPAQNRYSVVAGLDIAKGSSDAADLTVLTVMAVDVMNPIPDPDVQPGSGAVMQYNKVILGWWTFQGSFENEQYAGITRALSAYPRCSVMFVDSTAMGDPVTERLGVLLPWMNVVPYSFQVPQKSAGYKKYLLELKAGRIRYAAGPRTKETSEYQKFVQEHLDLQRFFHNGYLLCAAEDGYHDDFPDSAMLANLAAEEIHQIAPAMIEIEVSTMGGHSRSAMSMGSRADTAGRYRRGRLAPSRAGRYR